VRRGHAASQLGALSARRRRSMEPAAHWLAESDKAQGNKISGNLCDASRTLLPLRAFQNHRPPRHRKIR
jgi:hypothetical protein